MGRLQPDIDEVLYTTGSATEFHEILSFDAALRDAGIDDINVSKISSVVPERATLRTDLSPSEIRSRLVPGGSYRTVVARGSVHGRDCRAYSAIAGAWLESGYGLNVEVHGVDDSETEVEATCQELLERMAEQRDDALASEPVFACETALADGGSDEWTTTVAAAVYR